jgi:hypothetical protein
MTVENVEALQLNLPGYGIILWPDDNDLGPPDRIDDVTIVIGSFQRYNEYDLMSPIYNYRRDIRQHAWFLIVGSVPKEGERLDR